MLEVDKELAKRVIQEIDNLARSSADSKYTFTNFCETNNLFHENDKVLHNGSLFICCPFHKDEFPSLGIDEDRRIWNCLGCGQHGNFIDFVVSYTRFVEGREISFYQQVNELLKADPALQASIGASTIYKKASQSEFVGIGYEKFKIKSRKPTNYIELGAFLQRKKYSKDIIIFALLQMQSGIAPDLIYDNIVNGTISNTFKKKEHTNDYDLADLMSEEAPKKMNI